MGTTSAQSGAASAALGRRRYWRVRATCRVEYAVDVFDERIEAAIDGGAGTWFARKRARNDAPLFFELVDRGLLRHGTVWAGAGSARHVVGLSPTELIRLTRARVEDLTLESP